jgi:acyl carrier protein
MTDATVEQLSRIFAGVTGDDAPDPDADLVEGGVLDSLALVELLFAIEQELGVEIPTERLEVARFRTLGSIAELVAECRSLDPSSP